MNQQCFPSIEQFLSQVSAPASEPAYTHAQLSTALELDCLNPVAVLTALEQEEHFFLLESATAQKTISRYSFFGYQMEARFRCCAQSDGRALLYRQDLPEQRAEVCLNLPGYLPFSAQGEGGKSLNSPHKNGENPFELLFQRSIAAKRVLLGQTLWEGSTLSRQSRDGQNAQQNAAPGFQGGLVGLFGYEAVRHMNILRQPLRQLSVSGSRYGSQPEMLFYEVQRFFVIDNASQQIFAVYLLPLPSEGHTRPALLQVYREGQQVLAEMIADLRQKLRRVRVDGLLPTVRPVEKGLAAELSHQLWREDTSEAAQTQAIESLRRELRCGEGLQVVYSVGRQGPPVSPSLFYRLLRRRNPSPYMFFFKCGQQHLVGASPEIHLRCTQGRATIKPIAGTRPLPENLSESQLEQIIADLLADPKERSEHLMLIDLARNDLYTNCLPDSVHVVQSFAAEVYSHVVHIVSEVQGRLQPGKQSHQLFARTFPAGTLSGAPKVRAIELIDQYESSPRGFYGGCIGYFNYDGSYDTAIVIRSAWMDGEKTLVRSGGGLVCGSQPDYEIREHRQKLGILSSVLQAILQHNHRG